MTTDLLAGWHVAPFTYDGITHDVYRSGDGPGVILIPEIPGATPQVIALAERLVAAGFHVALPSIIGTPGRPVSGGYIAGSALRMCVSREFAAFARRADRPIAGFLRALARDVHAERGGPGVGVIGMCFSGGFALATAADDSVLAPVVSQPAVPPAIGAGRSATGLSPTEEAAIRRRAGDGLCALGLRFTNDLGHRAGPPRASRERARRRVPARATGRLITSLRMPWPRDPAGVTFRHTSARRAGGPRSTREHGRHRWTP